MALPKKLLKKYKIQNKEEYNELTKVIGKPSQKDMRLLMEDNTQELLAILSKIELRQGGNPIFNKTDIKKEWDKHERIVDETFKRLEKFGFFEEASFEEVKERLGRKKDKREKYYKLNTELIQAL